MVPIIEYVPWLEKNKSFFLKKTALKKNTVKSDQPKCTVVRIMLPLLTVSNCFPRV